MKTQTDITQEKVTTPIQRVQQEASDGGTAQLVDNRESTTIQRKLQDSMSAATENTTKPIQRKNNTGLPDNLKTGIENLSGYSMDDVKVHYNSSKPAQLQAHAYAQGTDIHLASGQEKHLPHEAWHVVQQKQGRVKPTKQLKSKVTINDDAGLEREADVMGEKAVTLKKCNSQRLDTTRLHENGITQMKMKDYLVSMDDKGKIGSIYIDNLDRIRLVHAFGPEVTNHQEYDEVQRFNIDLKGFMKHNDFIGDKNDKNEAKNLAKKILYEAVNKGEKIPEWATKVSSLEDAFSVSDIFDDTNDYFLYELMIKNNEIKNSHPSRGKLVKLSLDEEFIEELKKKVKEINKKHGGKEFDKAKYNSKNNMNKEIKNAAKIKVQKISGEMNRELQEFIADKKPSLLYAIHGSMETIKELLDPT